MTPQSPGIYEASCPLVFKQHKFEMEVYLSRKGHLRARVADAVKIRGAFQGKRVELFGKEWSWSRKN